MKKSELTKGEIGDFYWAYINLIPEDAELTDTLEKNTEEISKFLKSLPDEKWRYSYAPGKWSVLEIVQHLIDTDRIFQYRALSFTRNESKSLPGFDHDLYVLNSGAEKRTPSDLINEFRAVRESGLHLFRSFTDDMLARKGIMNDMTATARAIGFIMAGHALHHKDIISKRYL
ncbi:DinB family protein [Christiangramia crocea]|uniref:DinB family protein n=1 Tax=Christiangramia crocea TaxID=2904124 RepID=A0A9X2A827_9FLAO|nr:DinB family protein [Gramella crocea]MCG9972481.1 DinB family protein [Gramella crocea]